MDLTSLEMESLLDPDRFTAGWLLDSRQRVASSRAHCLNSLSVPQLAPMVKDPSPNFTTSHDTYDGVSVET